MPGSHAPGHIRDTFLEAIDVYAAWNGQDALPTVVREIKYQPHEISLAKACGLLWNCTDTLPDDAFNTLNQVLEVPVQRQSYAAAARGMLADLKAQEADTSVVAFRRIN